MAIVCLTYGAAKQEVRESSRNYVNSPATEEEEDVRCGV